MFIVSAGGGSCLKYLQTGSYIFQLGLLNHDNKSHTDKGVTTYKNFFELLNTLNVCFE